MVTTKGILQMKLKNIKGEIVFEGVFMTTKKKQCNIPIHFLLGM